MIINRSLVTLIACSIIGLPAAVSTAGTAEAATAATVDLHTAASAREWFHRFQTGKIDRSQLDERLKAQLTDAMINMEMRRLAPLGPPLSFTFISRNIVQNATGYNFLVTLKNAKVIESIAFDSNGKIAGIDFALYARGN